MKNIIGILLLTVNLFSLENSIHEIYHLNGKRNGWFRNYNKEGVVIEKRYYKDDEIFNGFEREYYPNGNLKYEAFFIDGKREGNVKWYYYDGNLESLDVYKNEKLLSSKSYFENGIIAYSIIYRNTKEIESKRYYKTGVLKKIHNKKQNLEYYPNGQVSVDWSKDKAYPPTVEGFLKICTGTYYRLREPIDEEEREKLIGTPYQNIEKDYDLRTYLAEDGDVREIIHYRNGKKEGLTVKLYYKRGYYLKTTMYKNDKKDGYETIYKKEGKLGERKIETLLNGSSDIYNKNDTLVSKVFYQKGKKVCVTYH